MPLQDRFYLFFRNLFKHFFRWTESRLDRSTRDSKAIYSDDTMLSIKDFIPGGLTRWITWGKLDSLSTRLSLFAQISSFSSPLCRFKMCDLSKQVQLVNKHRAQQLWLPKPSSSIISDYGWWTRWGCFRDRQQPLVLTGHRDAIIDELGVLVKFWLCQFQYSWAQAWCRMRTYDAKGFQISLNTTQRVKIKTLPSM